MFYAEIHDGLQKWRGSHFCEKLPVDYADTLWVKNFIEIAQSRTVSKINALLHFMQKFKMAAKSDGKVIFGESRLIYPVRLKFCRNRSISHRFLDKCAFALYAEIQDGHQKWQESNFWEKLPVDSTYTKQVKIFVEIALSCTVSEILKIFHFKR